MPLFIFAGMGAPRGRPPCGAAALRRPSKTTSVATRIAITKPIATRKNTSNGAQPIVMDIYILHLERLRINLANARQVLSAVSAIFVPRVMIFESPRQINGLAESVASNPVGRKFVRHSLVQADL